MDKTPKEVFEDMISNRTPKTKNIIIHPKMLRKLKEWLKESDSN